MAPLVQAVSRNAFGARYLAALFGLATVAASLAICRRLAGVDRAWPAMLLVLFPPAYLFVHEAAVALPSYWSLLFFSWVVVFLVMRIETSPRPALAAAAGFVSGVAFAAQPLSLAITAGAALAVCLGRDPRSALRNTASFSIGAAVGSMPFLLGWWLYDENPDVSGTRSVAAAWQNLFAPPIRAMLARAIGFSPRSFPDGGMTVSIFGALDPLVVWGFLALLGAVLIGRMVAFAERLQKVRWPTLTTADIFSTAAGLNILFIVASQRAHQGSPRYLLPLAWSLPFLVASFSSQIRFRGFRVVAVTVVVLAALNVLTTGAVMYTWLEPRFAWSIGNFDLEPAIAVLRAKGISRCYASFWEAYRIDFQTNEKIICSQPWNERFPQYPIPYQDRVDAAPRVAFVLTPHGWLKPRRFENDLAAAHVDYQKTAAGDFFVYHDFVCASCDAEMPLPESAWNGDAAFPPEFVSSIRHRGGWRSASGQTAGMAVEVALTRPAFLDRVTIDYSPGSAFRRPASLRVSVKHAGAWQPVAENLSELDPFRLVNGHPRYDVARFAQTARFAPIESDAVRIEVERPTLGAPWRIDDVELYERRPPEIVPDVQALQTATSPALTSTSR
jgi:hypothetical protein